MKDAKGHGSNKRGEALDPRAAYLERARVRRLNRSGSNARLKLAAERGQLLSGGGEGAAHQVGVRAAMKNRAVGR